MLSTLFKGKKKNIGLLICLAAVPILFYFYFLKWKTDAIYGDDLYMYKQYLGMDSFSEKVNIPVSFGKYRPVHGLSSQLIIGWFQKKLAGYYIFNIAIQAINSIILAAIVNLFLRSPYLSLLFGIIIGLTRFSFFNITQLLNGGALEGLAITFFLLSLFFIIRTLKKNDFTSVQKQRGVGWSILFANLSMYTHERYIVIFPFIILITLFFPALKILSKKQRIGLVLAAMGSIIINVLIKKYIFGMPFFVGTGGTTIDVSVSSSISFFTDALLSIFQINKGPEYLVGITYFSLPLINRIVTIFLFSSFILMLVLYLVQVKKFFVSKQKEGIADFLIFFFLFLLFGLFLIPAVVTIRLEQRWLQASLSVFILMTVIAFSWLNFKTRFIKSAVLTLFVLLFLWTDFNYLDKGGGNLYLSNSENIANAFKHAIDKGVIRPEASGLYVWEKQKDINTENGIQWTLGNGYFFEFYMGSTKQIIFTDSIFRKSYSYPDSSLVNFNKNDEQVIYIGNHIIDITNEYLQDSLKHFDDDRINQLISAKKIHYDQKKLVISNDNFNDFVTSGFYDNENGIRWTDGSAAIGFIGDYITMDTLHIELNTYMPPVCKNIIPEILVTDRINKTYAAVFIKRDGDKFIFRLQSEMPIKIQKISILADTIDASSDKRILSFPFISLELRK